LGEVDGPDGVAAWGTRDLNHLETVERREDEFADAGVAIDEAGADEVGFAAGRKESLEVGFREERRGVGKLGSRGCGFFGSAVDDLAVRK
jgi:hypothetical protein